MAANDDGFSKKNLPPDDNEGKIKPTPKKKKSKNKQRRSTKDIFVGDDVLVQQDDVLGQQSMAAMNRTKLSVPMPSEGTDIMATSTCIEKKPWGDVLGQRSLAVMNRPKLPVPMPSEGTTAMATSTSIENHPLVKAHKALQQAIAENENRSKPSGRMSSQKMSFVTTSSRERRPSVKGNKALQRAIEEYENRYKPSGRMPSQKMSFVTTSSRERRPSADYVVPDMPFCKFEDSCLFCGKKEFPNEDDEDFIIVVSTIEDILGQFIRCLKQKMLSDLENSELNRGDSYPEIIKTWSKRCLSILIGEIGYPATDEGLAEFWTDVDLLDKIPEIKFLSELVRSLL